MSDQVEVGVGSRTRLPWFEGWTVVGAAMVLQAFTIGLFAYCFTFWVGPWMEEFRVSRKEAMSAFAIGSVCISLLAPLAGRVLDHYSVRLLVAGGVFAYGIGLALISTATAFWQIVAIYGLLLSLGGLLAGPVAGQIVTVRWFDEKRGLALGIVSVGTSLGGFLLPPLVMALQAGMGWRAAHQVLAAVALALLLPLAYGAVRVPAVTSVANNTAQSGAIDEWPISRIIRMPVFWAVLMVLWPLAITNIAVLANLAPFAADLGVSPQRASFMMSLFAVSMVFGKVGIGLLADRLDLRQVSFGALALLAIAAGLLLVWPGELQLFLACALFGFSAGSYLNLTGTLVGACFGKTAFGTVIGLIFFGQVVLAGVAPLTGWLRDAFGSYDAVWWLLIGMSAICAPLLLGVKVMRSKV